MQTKLNLLTGRDYTYRTSALIFMAMVLTFLTGLTLANAQASVKLGAPDLVTASDNGSDTGDNITNDNTPTIEGSDVDDVFDDTPPTINTATFKKNRAKKPVLGLAVNHNQTFTETLTFSGSSKCANLMTGSQIVGNNQSDYDLIIKDRLGNYENCILTLTDVIGNSTTTNLNEFRILPRSGVYLNRWPVAVPELGKRSVLVEVTIPKDQLFKLPEGAVLKLVDVKVTIKQKDDVATTTSAETKIQNQAAVVTIKQVVRKLHIISILSVITKMIANIEAQIEAEPAPGIDGNF